MEYLIWVQCELPNRLVLEKAHAQIKARKLPQHDEKTLVCGFVKAVKLPDLRQPRLIHALPAPIAQRTALATARAGPGFGQILLHRPPGTNCSTTKVSNNTPSSVGSMSNRRLAM